MVDVGGRDINWLKEPCYKIKIVSGNIKKLLIFGNLIDNILELENAIEKVKTNLL